MNIQSMIDRIRTYVSDRVLTLIVFILVAILMFVLLYTHVKPETYEIELFSVSDRTIRSQVTIVDEQSTEKEKKRAAAEVEEAYIYKSDIVNNRLLLVNSLFDFVLEAKTKYPDDQDEQLAWLKKSFTNEAEGATRVISDRELSSLLESKPKELALLKTKTEDLVKTSLEKRIRTEDTATAKSEVEQRVRTSSIPNEYQDAVASIARYAIAPTVVYDKELTEKRRTEAMASVEPVRILQGQVIVQEGHLIDRETYRQLEMLGLLKNDPSYKPVIGLLIFIAVVLFLLYYYFRYSLMEEQKKTSVLLLSSAVFLFALFIMKLADILNYSELYELTYAYPAALAAMLLTVLVNERIAIVVTIALSACGTLIFNEHLNGTLNVEMGLYILFSGLAGILFLMGSKNINLLRAGMLVSLVNVFVILFLKLLVTGQYTEKEFLYFTLFSFLSGLLSAVLAMGMLPFIEAAFGMLSKMKLIELSNPNHPLLKKLLTETPGTYHHSVMVANLSEAACEAIGANGLLARVGCYYHDIGKTSHPQLFIENQGSLGNPHDRLSPEVSKNIIISHVTDGVKMLKEHKFPREIIDIAEQHHGTTLVKYFYFQAKEKNPDIVEHDFRYAGPKPQTKEAAVISIADSVEAAVRSMDHPTTEQIETLVDQIVADRLCDGQFNECDISLKEVQIVKKTLCEALSGIFHSRIKYPGTEEVAVAEQN
ncbi:HD family phosphohydrolase [Bacillus sp. REN10]|uniref:HD family phosphohydrolase n=1 Tax=Bacillus sp. REN10 TaxID=2782541 RepID=UPI00193B651E|nr:HD family phosphohydrolase [Bacillus sp. REN10]